MMKKQMGDVGSGWQHLSESSVLGSNISARQQPAHLRLLQVITPRLVPMLHLVPYPWSGLIPADAYSAFE